MKTLLLIDNNITFGKLCSEISFAGLLAQDIYYDQGSRKYVMTVNASLDKVNAVINNTYLSSRRADIMIMERTNSEDR